MTANTPACSARVPAHHARPGQPGCPPPPPPRMGRKTTPWGVVLRGGRPDGSPDMKRMKRILVVDDDAASCQAATAILQELGCAVETMADSDTALDRLRHVVPDALLVDLNIPGHGRWRLCAGVSPGPTLQRRTSRGDGRDSAGSGRCHPHGCTRVHQEARRHGRFGNGATTPIGGEIRLFGQPSDSN